MPSPPKPWERAGAGAEATSSSVASSVTPALPDRPSTLTSAGGGATTTALGTPATNALTTGAGAYNSPYSSAYGGLGSTYGGLGSGYGSYGSSYGSYSSPYSRMGMGYGSGLGGYGGYGGYGGGYGGYGMGMGGMGMGGMGMGGMGMGGMPGQPGDVSLTQRMESGTQATFELISSIVGAFGGFAQMLESTFMATHSSFFAMVGVADQFAHLRNYLGQVLSIFALARYLKNLFLRLTGRAPAIDLDPREFKDFAKSGGSIAAGGQGAKARPSKRPLIVFFLAVVGLPYLMGKLVRLITARQEEERQRLEQQGLLPPGWQNMTPQQQQQHVAQQQALQQQQQQQQPQHASAQSSVAGVAQDAALDPSKLTFVRAMYAYNASDPLELTLKSNDIVAVLSKVDPSTGQESQWWKGRTRDGRVGWFPSTYVESLESAKERASKLTSGSEAAAVKAAVESAPQKSIPKPTATPTTR